MPHEDKLSVLKTHNQCNNCLQGGHYAHQCKSVHRCKKCHGQHHTLLHYDPSKHNSLRNQQPNPVNSHATMGLKSQSLLMICRVLIHSFEGSCVVAQALLDSASSASFISDQLSQSLYLPWSHHNIKITGVGGIYHILHIKASTNFHISPIQSSNDKIAVTAVVVPKVTCELPHHHIPFDSQWSHLSDLELADPDFGTPGRIDVLLGVDVFTQVLLHGRRVGPVNSLVGIETKFGWIIAGATNAQGTEILSHHITTIPDDIFKRFWEVEEPPHQEDTNCWSR